VRLHIRHCLQLANDCSNNGERERTIMLLDEPVWFMNCLFDTANFALKQCNGQRMQKYMRDPDSLREEDVEQRCGWDVYIE
jgi:hypothetical protein